jgi:lipoate-protein ligase A
LKIRHFWLFVKLILPMEYIEWSSCTPEMNLAMDEALLVEAEEGKRGESLRIWSPGSPFIVLGYSRRAAAEVDIEACRRASIPVLRRASGGGTVLQGAGCVNYSLVLRIPSEEPRPGITDTTREIMGRHADLFTNLLGEKVRHEGESDLTFRGKKFSGNAQRRLVRHVMFHGTFLLDADLAMISRFLRHPESEPAYRGKRPHAEFVTNIGLPREAVAAALAAEWGANGPAADPPLARAESLCAGRYARTEWSLRR